jgi:membrane-associated phospholipid phosphatase
MQAKPKSAVSLAVALVLALAAAGRADEVTDWNQVMFRSALMTNPTASPLAMTRTAAIVSAAVFDAVNGIDGPYAPVHVTPAAPAGASRRAAAVQAAYASLLLVLPAATHPSLKGALDFERANSLAIISGSRHETATSIADGIAWGQTVAEAIVAWRSSDGFTPAPSPFLGGTDIGEWRPTPPALLPGAGPQFAYMTPWVMAAPSQFRPGGPPPLTSARYAQDFNETKSMGSLTSTRRSTDQTVSAYFWASTSASYLWNHVALQLMGRDRHASLVEKARLLAQVNLAMADAAIACWEAKYHYVAWRPVTAIPLADTDGNPATEPDPSWSPLFATPNHPEYPSGHSTVSSAAASVLAHAYGDRTHFRMGSDLLLGVARSFGSFSSALDAVADARVFAGIHYRFACDDGRKTGTAVARYVLDHAMARVRHGREDDDNQDDRDDRPR